MRNSVLTRGAKEYLYDSEANGTEEAERNSLMALIIDEKEWGIFNRYTWKRKFYCSNDQKKIIATQKMLILCMEYKKTDGI